MGRNMEQTESLRNQNTLDINVAHLNLKTDEENVHTMLIEAY